MKEQEYLDILTDQLRCKKARDMVKEEVKGHIEDQAETYRAEGMPQEEALEEAVKQMGDPVETGVALDQLHHPKMAWKMILFIICLNALGLLITQMLIPFMADGYAYADGRQGLYSGIGVVVMLLVCYFDYTNIGKYCIWLAGTFLLLMGIEIFFRGTQVNGAVSFTTFPVAISLWMLMFLYVPIYGALLYRFRGEGRGAVLKAVLLAVAPGFLALRMPNLSLGIGLFGILMVMLTIALLKNWYQVRGKRTAAILWGIMIVFPILFFFLMVARNQLPNYQTARISAFFHPEQYAEGAGYFYQTLRSIVGGLQLFGSASENSMAQIGRLPMGDSDYALILLMTYYGIVAGLVILLLFGFLVFQIFHLSICQKNQLGMMMGSGCGLVFAFWVLGYTLQSLGLLPTTSVYLPFFTRGGSGVVVAYALIGIWLSVYRYQNVVAEKAYKEKKLFG